MPTSNAGVRVGYRELIADTTTNRAELTTAQSTGLSTALEKSNQLLGSVMGQAAPDGQVHALDATAQNLISGLGAEQAAKLDKRTPDVFVSKLKGSVFFSGSGDKGYIRWADLGAELNERTVYSRTPALTFCLARYTAPAPKDKKERKRREGPTGPQKLAEGVEVDELQQNEVTKAQKHRLNTLGKVIKEAAADAEAAGGRRAVNLFRVVLHPTSFSQTVRRPRHTPTTPGPSLFARRRHQQGAPPTRRPCRDRGRPSRARRSRISSTCPSSSRRGG